MVVLMTFFGYSFEWVWPLQLQYGHDPGLAASGGSVKVIQVYLATSYRYEPWYISGAACMFL